MLCFHFAASYLVFVHLNIQKRRKKNETKSKSNTHNLIIFFFSSLKCCVFVHLPSLADFMQEIGPNVFDKLQLPKFDNFVFLFFSWIYLTWTNIKWNIESRKKMRQKYDAAAVAADQWRLALPTTIYIFNWNMEQFLSPLWTQWFSLLCVLVSFLNFTLSKFEHLYFFFIKVIFLPSILASAGNEPCGMCSSAFVYRIRLKLVAAFYLFALQLLNDCIFNVVFFSPVCCFCLAFVGFKSDKAQCKHKTNEMIIEFICANDANQVAHSLIFNHRP